MKKLWIVLLSVALIMAFAMPVCAADVKFSGSYVAQGYYENNRAITDTDSSHNGGGSLMNVWQRLRVQTDFQVQEGLKLTTRFDALEKIWGAARSTQITASNSLGVGDAESENIKFTHAYLSANLWGGLLRVGYQTQAKFGTDFADNGELSYGPRVRYDYVVGPWTFIALWDKIEGSEYYSPAGPSGNIATAGYQVDYSADKYVGAFVYNWGKGETGLLVYYYLITNNGNAAINTNPATDTGYKTRYWIFDPYVKAQLGPFYVEGEVVYITGKANAWESAAAKGQDIDRSGWEAYVTATYDFAPMYAGATFVWVQGDDPGSTDKNEAGAGGGVDFNPCLMLGNYDLGRWEGKMGAASAASSMSGGLGNVLLGQIFFGIKPIPKLDIKASFTMAQADQNVTSSNWVSKDYGNELDITATYKIYDNLSYMVGFAYLWAGDYWKGTDSSTSISNDYLVTHKLTLSF